MSRLGLHVKTGSRNGYGLVVAQYPAVVFGVGEGGAVLEAMENGAWGIYRDIEHYNNHPEGMGLNDPNLSRADAFNVAETLYPFLRSQWEKNPADYYAVINESGANDTSVIKNYVNYEWRMMELAEADGYSLCLCNLFSGTPDDGSVADGDPTGGMETWKIEYGALLRRGAAGGHIYGRHCYGFPMLTPVDHNSDRPFREAEWLRSQGIEIGIVLSECGLYGGEHQTDVTTIMEQIQYYDILLQNAPTADMFLGMCWWTYGDWASNVNIETISAELAVYLEHNPSPAWEPGGYMPPPTNREPNRIRHTIHLLPQETSDEERHAVVEALKATNTAFTHSHDVVEAVMFWSTTDGEIVAWNPERWDFDLEEYFSWLNVRYTVRHFSDLGAGDPEFRYEYWPVIGDKHVTQLWGARPAYYAQFGLPGHGGVDMRAPRGTLIRCVADGTVDRVHLDPDSHNFGIHVYVLHANNELTGYSHLLTVADDLALGQSIAAGQIVGVADNTGLSDGDHLHFLRKRPGETYYDGKDSWLYSLFDPTALLKAVAPDAYWPDEVVPPVIPPTPGPKYDVYEAMTSDQPFGPLYEVRTEIWSTDRWTPGPQQRHQTHSLDDSFYHTKGGDGEHKPAEWEQLMADTQLIYRSIDTSPGDGKYYEITDQLNGVWSAWCPRFMAVGETYFRYPWVIFHDKETCTELSEGRQASLIVLRAVHEEMTFYTGITLQNVIELEWLDTDGVTVIERYYYAKGYGLVGWGYGQTGKRAAISEIHAPGARPDNIRETIPCL